VRLRECRVECEGLPQKHFDLAKIDARVLGPLALPKAHGVIVDGLTVLGLKLGKPPEALDDLLGLAWRTVIGPRQEGVAARIAGVQIRRAQQRFNGVVVLAERVERHPQTNGHTW